MQTTNHFTGGSSAMIQSLPVILKIIGDALWFSLVRPLTEILNEVKWDALAGNPLTCICRHDGVDAGFSKLAQGSKDMILCDSKPKEKPKNS